MNRLKREKTARYRELAIRNAEAERTADRVRARIFESIGLRPRSIPIDSGAGGSSGNTGALPIMMAHARK